MIGGTSLETPKEYILFKGEEILGVGTLQELAEQLGIKLRTLMCYKTPSHMKRTKNGRKLILLEGDAE